MLKKGMFIAAGAVLVIGLLFGRQGWSYVSTAVSKIQQSVKDSVPVEFDLDRARHEIKKLEPEIRRAHYEIAKEEVAVERLEKEIGQHRETLAKSKTEIQRLDNDLKSGSVNFVYYERSYTRTQVEQDLKRRFENHKSNVSMTDTLQKILDARRNGLTAARDKLTTMQGEKKRLEVEVAKLDAEHRMIEVAKDANEFNFDDSQLARTRGLIDDIKTRLQVEAKMANGMNKIQPEIRLDEPETSDDISEEIAKYFSDKPESSEFVKSEK